MTASREQVLSELVDRIRRLRKAHGWSQQELGRRSGLGRSIVANLECGRAKDVGYIELVRLASAFGISVVKLVGTVPIEVVRLA